MVILACHFIGADSASAQGWTQSYGGYLPWTAVCSSSDGSIVWASSTNGPIFYSTNSGSTWQWMDWNNPSYTTGMACSQDATIVAAVTGNLAPGLIYVTTDFGTNWPAVAVPAEDWTCVACSANGGDMVAAATNGVVYLSTDTGTNWAPCAVPDEYWISIAMSGDGSQIAVVATNGPVCVSTNGGDTWTTNNPSGDVVADLPGGRFKSDTSSGSGDTNWQAVACSADKTKLYAAAVGGPIYISTNAGSTWTASMSPGTNWLALACSADGTRIIAAVKNGPIYTSTNSGAVWISNNIPSFPWSGVSSSADGGKLVAVSGTYNYEAPIYTLQYPVSPSMKIAVVSNCLSLAWIKPSTNFVVQESADLQTWTALGNSLTLDLSNLEDQVTVPMTNSAGFYRLITL